MDGTTVDDDNSIEYYAKANEIFVIKLISEDEEEDQISEDEKEVQILDDITNASKNVIAVGQSSRVQNIIVIERGESSGLNGVGQSSQVFETGEIVGVNSKNSLPAGVKMIDKNGEISECVVVNPDHALLPVPKENVDILALANNFPIKDENFSMKVQEKIKNNIRLSNSEKIQVIQRVVDDMQKIYGVNPSSFIIQAVATKLLFVYPILCQVDDEGNKIGNGQFTTIRQIKDRLYYLNNTKLLKTKLLQPFQSTTKRAATHTGKSTKKRNAGCPNFNPASKLTKEELNKKKKLLQKEFRLSKKQRNENKIISLLNDTYPAQREFLVQTPIPTLVMLEKEWPFLFESKYIKMHFQKLCQLDFTNKDIQNRMEKIHNLFMFGQTSKTTNENELVKSNLDEIFKYFKVKSSENTETDFYALVEVTIFFVIF